MTAMPLQPFTAAETARLAAIEAAPHAPESHAATIERMAQAIHQEQNRGAQWGLARKYVRDEYCRLAVAAYRAEHENGAA